MSERIWRIRQCLRRERPLPVLAPVAVMLILAGFFLNFVNGRIQPVLETAATSQATNLMTQIISAAVDDCLEEHNMGYADFVTVETDVSGKVVALTGNTAANSRFKRVIVDTVIERLGSLDRNAIKVPLGSLTGQPLLTGIGPPVRVRVDSVGSVTADFVHSFTAAGVNQTLQRVCLNITATIFLFLPGEVLPVTVNSSICVAETVIVGETPDTYLNLEKENG